MTGLERNSDIVFAASYAPLLQVSPLSQYPEHAAENVQLMSTLITLNGCVADRAISFSC